MPQCAAFGCFTRSEGTLSTFIFPKHPKERAVWIAKVKRDKWKPGKCSRLCSKHFTSDCFEITADQSVRLGIRRRLLPGSIPTLFSHTKQTLIRQQNAMERRGITCESSESQTVGTVVMTLPFVNKQLDHEAVGYARFLAMLAVYRKYFQ